MGVTSKPVLFHIGLHKTASTSLQESYFLPENGYLQPRDKKLLFRTFVDKFSTDMLTDVEREEIESFVNEAWSNELVPVFSHERLSGFPLSGGYDRLAIRNRIQSEFPNAKVLCVFREQKSWLYSAWKQMLEGVGGLTLNELLQEGTDIAVKMPAFRFEHLDYALELRSLQEHFGADNICFYPFEMMKTDFGAFDNVMARMVELERVAGFKPELMHANPTAKLSVVYWGMFVNRYIVKSNVSPFGFIHSNRRFYYKYWKRFNRWVRRNLPEVPFSERLAIKHKRQIKEVVGDRYKSSNRSVAEELGIDLGKLGYDV